jgi:hypothetical protein
MSDADQKWLESGRGLPPERTWSVAADALLLGVEDARHQRERAAARRCGKPAKSNVRAAEAIEDSVTSHPAASHEAAIASSQRPMLS